MSTTIHGLRRHASLGRMTLLACLGAALALPAAGQAPSPAPVQVAAKPNVVVIVLDDLGFADLGAFGSEIRTPNIDKLAAQGLRYNNFNVCPVSSPTRASLLTGRDNNAVGMGNVANVDLGPSRPDMRGRISHNAATVAQVLQDSGYGTYAVGKWHAAPLNSCTPAGPFDYWPLAKGFGRYYGYLDGETNQFFPQLTEDNHFLPVPQKAGYHLSEDLVDHACQFLTDHVANYPSKPFFEYVAFGASHSPHQVPRKYIDMYRGQYDKGWDVLREERFERQKRMGIIPANTVLHPRDAKVKPWAQMSADERRLAARFMETYAGYITHADEQIGRLIEHLKATGQYEKTMVVLLSDNGATNSGGENGLDNFAKWFSFTPQTVAELLPRIEEIGGPRMEALYPQGWAMAGNTPFPEYKGDVYAGGVRTPLVISWPQGIKADSQVRTQYAHITDITPTVLDVLQTKMPATFHGIEQMPLHGVSLAPTFTDAKARTGHDVQYYLFASNRSIYQDGWKAIATHRKGSSFDQDTWELYHVSEDYSESKNLAAQQPERLEALKKLWASEVASHGAILKEGSLADMVFIPSYSPAARSRFTYSPKMGPINTMAAPQLNNRAYSFTTTVERRSAKDEGVLVAMGEPAGGYTLYVKDDRLVYDYNYYGQHFRVVSTEKVPMGKSTLNYEFQKAGFFQGVGRLFINDRPVGEVVLPKTFKAVCTFDPFCVGRDAVLPTSEDYRDRGEFPFSGKMGDLIVEIKPEAPRPGGPQGAAPAAH
ncbi:arylsulfatase [Holophaga foetida]|uniref:arylsulfatase n=1 Tax=Holophaga foetida TaxID=35839 RepID=UPI0002471C77|nr:arylsulfatase [Holophaga foetida]